LPTCPTILFECAKSAADRPCRRKAGDTEGAAADLASARAINPAITEELSRFGIE
jgi:hypothetical protein